MEIRIESLLEGARRAAGTVIVIDVFRAFTTAAVALARGAEKIILTAEPEEALALRAAGLGELCMGEVGGIRPPGFDFGNSPFELSQADVAGKTLIQSTRAGTVGVCAVPQPQALYAAAFVTAGATVRAILRERPPLVTLVAMGARTTQMSSARSICAIGCWAGHPIPARCADWWPIAPTRPGSATPNCRTSTLATWRSRWTLTDTTSPCA